MFVLASASPRRQELLRQIGCSFWIMTLQVEEETTASSAAALVQANARRKAVAGMAMADELPVLGADTVVSMGNQIFGKPQDTADAERMLRQLSGRTHEVSTGIAFAWQDRVWQAVETTRVTFAALSDAELQAYLSTGEPLDKAGAYGIQGRAAAFIERIEGSYSNVVGLPLYRTAALAKEAGVDLYGSDGSGST